MATDIRPKVTVLMPVYNGGKYLAKSIESILRQTFEDFEFLIINDGSEDNSLSIIKSYAEKDKRIRIINQTNRGLIASLNHGLDLSRGQYIARQDADDLSLVARLEKQVSFLESNPSIGLLGTNYFFINSNGKTTGCTDVFTEPNDLKLAEFLSNQFGHGSIMLRAEILKHNNIYFDSEFKHAEDHELWVRLSRVTKLANLKEPLYKWRQHTSSVTSENEVAMQAQWWRIRQSGFTDFRLNRKSYHLFSFHPLSISSGPLTYLKKKNTLWRDLSLIYCQNGYRRWGLVCLLVAAAHAPWVKITYLQIYIICFDKSRIDKISYEYI